MFCFDVRLTSSHCCWCCPSCFSFFGLLSAVFLDTAMIICVVYIKVLYRVSQMEGYYYYFTSSYIASAAVQNLQPSNWRKVTKRPWLSWQGHHDGLSLRPFSECVLGLTFEGSPTSTTTTTPCWNFKKREKQSMVARCF